MAAIANVYVEQLTQQTTTSSTFGNVSGAQIASGSLVTGAKYLLLVAVDSGIAGTTMQTGLRVTHGGAAWADSEVLQESIGSSERTKYFWFHVFTQAAGENIDVQLRSADNTTVARADTVVMHAIRLDADLTEDTDYAFAELATDNALGSTFEDGASKTWTPATNGDEWLVIYHQQIDVNSVTVQSESQMVISGGATFTGGLYSREGEVTSDIFGQFFARGIALTNASTTLKVQGRSETADAHSHLHSKVFALRLNAFRNFVQGYTDAELDGTVTSYADLVESESLTPDIEGDVFALTCCIDDLDSGSVQVKHRLQVDGADTPAGQTTENYGFAGGFHDATDQHAFVLFSRLSQTAASHTWDHDANVSAAVAGRGYSNRSMVVFTMELPAAGGVTEADGAAAGGSTVASIAVAIWNGVTAAAGLAASAVVGAAFWLAVATAPGVAAGDAPSATVLEGGGAAAGVASASVVGAAVLPGVASSAGTGAASADGADGASGGQGVASGVATVTGVSAATAQSDASTAGAATVSAVGASVAGADGAANGAASLSGVGGTVHAGDGGAAGVGSAAAVSGATAGAVASSIGIATVAGAGADGSAGSQGLASGTSTVLAVGEAMAPRQRFVPAYLWEGGVLPRGRGGFSR